MRDLRSLAAGGHDLAVDVARESFTAFSQHYPVKLVWFLSHGYSPHEWQMSFHAADTNTRLRRFRHLVAGRRGGKTMSAAWEVLFYCLFPSEFWRDAHSVEGHKKPLWVWVLTADHEIGRPARIAFQNALDDAGMMPGVDYKWNKTEKTVEFLESGTFLQFKTADNPQSLRGAGLDILWIDEAAFITSKDAWDVVRPALSDKMGLVITTTTPHGKNWFWDYFFSGKVLDSPHHFRVEYTSIDRPNFQSEEWVEAKATMHPALFAQEYMASFDAMAGLTLNGDWLHYYTMGDPEPGEITMKDDHGQQLKLRKYLGVDTSTGEAEDEFAICCIGITEDLTQAFLLDYWSGLIQFPDQIDKVREWQQTWRPELIGIESNAYQKVLAQMVNRLQGFPGVVPVMSKGNKTERLISMTPLFKIGKIRIHKRMVKFIDQWVSYNGKSKVNRDDILDCVEIGLGVAGVILPRMEVRRDHQPGTEEEEAIAQIAALRKPKFHDPELGSEV